MDQEHNMTPPMDMWEDYDHIALEERCISQKKVDSQDGL